MSIPSSVANDSRPFRILPVIIVSQFAGTSLWFASNAIVPDLQRAWNLPPDAVATMTSAVQLGFILGTLASAFFTISDRFSPRLIFFLSSLLGAGFNLLLAFSAGKYSTFLLLRFLIGISLAGIYPVGMKIASGWYRLGLGNALGFLVGALVLGTSFPHLIRSLGAHLAWQDVLLSVSAIAAAGGVLMALLVPDGPHLTRGVRFSVKALPAIFRSRDLRAAAFGYFGHMWELYTFYAFVPLLLSVYASMHPQSVTNVSFWSFCTIAAGSIGCVGGGILSNFFGSARVAWTQLFASGLLCLCSPFLFVLPTELFLLLLLLWGLAVVGDSPQFSTLVARYAPPELVGSALTISNSIGFAITIVSISVISSLSQTIMIRYLFVLLAPGPILGLIASSRLVFRRMKKLS
ncbi:MAG: MFS transporter [Ignavibacteriae bacterium]|nr:MFS transporter [Ignavibacteria bacterium]MBI3364119.1 MFS transporter [Ignavibacteriota bacterium]